MHRAVIKYTLKARINGRIEEELAVRGALIQDDHDFSCMGLQGNHTQYAWILLVLEIPQRYS